MRDYKYNFSISDGTKEALRRLTIDEWVMLLEDILQNKSINYNINFTEFDPKVRLRELYSLTLKYGIGRDNYQSALIQLFISYYGNPYNAKEIFCLICVIDYVQPSRHYKRLEMLVTSSEYRHMVDVKAETQYSLAYYLVNAIMQFDVNGNLYQYLRSTNDSNELPEYYQIMIRYLSSYGEQGEFDRFMNKNFNKLSDSHTLKLVFNTFNEYAFYSKNLSLIYYWLFAHEHELKKINEELFDFFVDNLFWWLNEQDEKLKNSVLYYHLYSFLFSFKDDYYLTKDVFLKLKDELNLINKNKGLLLERLGAKDNRIRIQYAKDNSIDIIFRNRQKVNIEAGYLDLISYLKSGLNKGMCEVFDRADLLIEEKYILASN